MRYQKLLLVSCYFLLVSGCVKKATVLEGYEEGAYLGLKFVPRMSLSYKQTQNISTTMEVKKMAHTINQSIEIQTTRIVEDTGAIISLRISFDDVVGTARVRGEIKPIKSLDELKGKVASLKLSREGKIKELKGLEEVDYFRKSGESPERQFEETFGFLPNKKVKVGESWTKEFDDKIASYTLKAFEKKDGAVCAKIGLRADIDVTKTVEQQGMRSKIKITGEERGEIFFDIEKGIVIESNRSASIEGSQKLKGPTPMTIPVYIDEETNTKFIK